MTRFADLTSTQPRAYERNKHELFQSELKSSVDGALLSKTIRGSSSGENLHRAAVMELIFERSIQERRGRASTEVNIPLLARPGSQIKKSSEEQNASVPPVEPLVPVPDPLGISRHHPKPQTTPSEAAPNRKPVPKPEFTKKTIPVATQSDASERQKDTQNVGTGGSKPSEDVYFGCLVSSCRVVLRRNQLKDGLYCSVCPGRTIMVCTNCMHYRDTKVRNCEGCGLTFLK